MITTAPGSGSPHPTGRLPPGPIDMGPPRPTPPIIYRVKRVERGRPTQLSADNFGSRDEDWVMPTTGLNKYFSNRGKVLYGCG